MSESRGIEPGQVHASGDTAATEAVQEQVEEFEQPQAETMPEDRARSFDFTGFQRMRTSWSEDDRLTLQRYQAVVNEVMLTEFADAYSVMNDLYDTVRQPVTDADGTIQCDAHGLPLWRRTPTGGFYEDWSQLGYRQREDFLFRITTAIFAWQQKAADFWGEAMFAKAKWTEHFALAFDGIEGRATVDARTQRGNIEAADDRYFAVFMSLLSRKADALVRSLELISQRIKDAMVAGV